MKCRVRQGHTSNKGTAKVDMFKVMVLSLQVCNLTNVVTRYCQLCLESDSHRPVSPVTHLTAYNKLRLMSSGSKPRFFPLLLVAVEDSGQYSVPYSTCFLKTLPKLLAIVVDFRPIFPYPPPYMSPTSMSTLELSPFSAIPNISAEAESAYVALSSVVDRYYHRTILPMSGAIEDPIGSPPPTNKSEPFCDLKVVTLARYEGGIRTDDPPILSNC